MNHMPTLCKQNNEIPCDAAHPDIGILLFGLVSTTTLLHLLDLHKMAAPKLESQSSEVSSTQSEKSRTSPPISWIFGKLVTSHIFATAESKRH